MMRAAPLFPLAAVLTAGPAAAQFLLPDGQGDAAPLSEEVPDPLDLFADPPPSIERIPPAFPAVPNRLGVQATCSMIYSITEQGLPHDTCGACEINAPVPPGVTPAPGLLDRITQDFLDTSRTAVDAWRFEYGDPGVRYGTVIHYQVPNRPPEAMPEPPYPDMCLGDLIS